jgi:pimeloyl-ACP methyl ester carboxylesterase
MKLLQPLCSALATILVSAALSVLALSPAAAGDHFDASVVAHDAGADIADLFAFLDPTDITKVVLIATVHPNIVPGQMTSEAAFDENIRYRFEIYNDHVNLDSPVLDSTERNSVKKAYIAKVRPKLLIDVTFSKRAVGIEPQTGTGGGFIPTNLRKPKLQTASLVFQGFKDPDGNRLLNRGKFPIAGAPLLTVTPTLHTPTAPPFNAPDIVVAPGQTVQFFAGAVDDPFFFDLPAFTSYLDTIRNGAPSAAAFGRARDTFAGYNVLAIGLRIPLVLLRGTNGPIIGVDFLTQRHSQSRRLTQVCKRDQANHERFRPSNRPSRGGHQHPPGLLCGEGRPPPTRHEHLQLWKSGWRRVSEWPAPAGRHRRYPAHAAEPQFHPRR